MPIQRLCMLLGSVLLLYASCSRAAQLTSQPLYSYRDEAYAFDVKLGTPAQTLRLSFDLMRSGIAVAGASCKNCAGANKMTYDGKRSSTSSCKRGENVIGGATAVECLDAIQTLDVSLKAYSFLEVISAEPNSCFARQPFDGVVGLCDTVSSSNIFGLYMKRTCSLKGDYTENAGTITHGGVDSSACVVPASPQPFEYYNGSHLLSMKLDSVQTTTSHRNIDEEFEGPWRATFTTTSADVLVPTKLFNDLNAYWKAMLKDGEWTIDCDNQHKIYLSYNCTPMQQPGTVSCFFVGPISLQQFIYRVGDTCVLRIRPRDASDPLRDYWTFGLPLFRSVCTLFDFDSSTVTFAEPKESPNEKCTYPSTTQPAPCFPTNLTSAPPTKQPGGTTGTTTQAPRLQSTTASGSTHLLSLRHCVLLVTSIHAILSFLR